MNSCLLAAVLIAVIIVIFVQLWIVRLLKEFGDYSKEDAQVKAATERTKHSEAEVTTAIDDLPK